MGWRETRRGSERSEPERRRQRRRRAPVTATVTDRAALARHLLAHVRILEPNPNDARRLLRTLNMSDFKFYADTDSRHPCFPWPPGHAKIWRYMELAKLVSMLHKRALHFATLDSFQDPCEGVLPAANQHELYEIYLSMGRCHEEAKAASQADFSWTRRLRVCCWNIAECESEALWKTHAPERVAVQSTFQRLYESFDQRGTEPDAIPISIGAVEYLDYSKHATSVKNNSFSAVMWKRQSFQHEQELRAVLVLPETYRKGGGVYTIIDGKLDPPLPPEPPRTGVHVNVNLNTLVERIYVSPVSAKWFKEVVEVVIEKFGFQFPVERSPLFDKPMA